MQCTRTEGEVDQLVNVPYLSVVGSLLYAQAYIRFNISFAVGMLEYYQRNPRLNLE